VDHWEPDPGFESLPPHRASILDLLNHRNNLMFILASANEFCNSISSGLPAAIAAGSGNTANFRTPLPSTTGFLCLEKQYNLSVYIQQHLCSYIEDQVGGGELFFMQHGTSRSTPSLTNPVEASIAHLITCMHVFQQALSCNGFSTSTTPPLQASRSHKVQQLAAHGAHHSGEHGYVSPNKGGAGGGGGGASALDRAYQIYASTHGNQSARQGGSGQLTLAQQTAQYSPTSTNFDFVGWLRVLLFKELSDTAQINPPGKLINPNIHPRTNTVVWRYAAWVLWLIEQGNTAGKTEAKNSLPFVWLPNVGSMATLAFRDIDDDSSQGLGEAYSENEEGNDEGEGDEENKSNASADDADDTDSNNSGGSNVDSPKAKTQAHKQQRKKIKAQNLAKKKEREDQALPSGIAKTQAQELPFNLHTYVDKRELRSMSMLLGTQVCVISV